MVKTTCLKKVIKSIFEQLNTLEKAIEAIWLMILYETQVCYGFDILTSFTNKPEPIASSLQKSCFVNQFILKRRRDSFRGEIDSVK